MSFLLSILIRLFALLPFKLIYPISDFLYILLYRIIGYRKTVVRENLMHAFPSMTIKERENIERQYFHHLCDVMLETLKLSSISREQLIARCTLHPSAKQLIEKYRMENKSIVLVSGHCGNWEWVGSAFSLQTKMPLTVSYRPATNSFIDPVLLNMRTRFGTTVIPVQDVIRQVLKDKGKVTAIGFIADQTPPKEYAYWTNFLNREVPVYTGAEKIARKFEYPVLFVHIRKMHRGHYEINLSLINDKPASLAENELTRMHTKLLAEDIQKQPWNWLWSHKRWKHKKS